MLHPLQHTDGSNDMLKCGLMIRSTYIASVIAGLFGVASIALGYLYYQLYTEHQQLTAENQAATERIATTTSALTEARGRIENLSETLADVEHDLTEAENRNEEFQDQISSITGTVSDLEKLSETDEELLQKYSKVSFLNEHYAPSDLSDIEDEYKYDEERDHQLHADVMPFFEEMVEDAKDDGIDLWVTSAYRSFEYQSELKGQYTVTYGSGANAFSADQGFSEHQLGTTIDFTTRGLNGALRGFENTDAYEWLTENAYKYGFTLSYPPNNAYYVYEPWHWRFVGEELAEDLHDDGQYFYDLPQREIDQYLLHIFD